MIRVRFRRRRDRTVGFTAAGHAGAAEHGRDLVCAAVSALTQNCAQALRRVASADVRVRQAPGYLDCRLRSEPSAATETLFEALRWGLYDLALDHPDFVQFERRPASRRVERPARSIGRS